MCEIFGLTSKKTIDAGKLLKEFYSHSDEHPHGWGLALFDGHDVSVEREPVKAGKSTYLKNRLKGNLSAPVILAHIRRATTGNIEYGNCHPFVKTDESGRTWTLIHNGTIFEAPQLSPYQYEQSGATDSERILLYLVDKMNRRFLKDFSLFEVNARLDLLSELIAGLAPENKLNLIFYDGEYMYVHTNAPGTLMLSERPGHTIISTTSLDDGAWMDVPLNRLLVYKEGALVYEGKEHPHTYVEDPEKIKYLYLAFAGL